MYPLRYDSVVAPSSLELPTANRRDHVFGRLSVPVTRQLPDDEVARIAASHSNQDETVLVPTLEDGGVRLAPEVVCPRCGERAVVGRFGRAPLPSVASVAELIARTRGLAPGDTAKLEYTSPHAVVRCMRSDDGTTRSWHLTRKAGASLEPLVAELVAQLTAAGSRCSEPRHAPGYSELDEVVP
jgi:hypothetical protein